MLGFAQPAVGAAKLADVSGHWAESSMKRWQQAGLIQGLADGTLGPDRQISRAEVATIINRLFGFQDASAEPFSDVLPTAWYAEEITKARAAGYYRGFPGNEARAETVINRQDTVVLLARLLNLVDSSAGENVESPVRLPFIDADEIAGYAARAVDVMLPYIRGYEDGTFRPSETITRAEFATLLDRLVSRLYANPGDYSEEIIDGHVLINRSDVQLHDTWITGHAYLTPGIGDGDVRLTRVVIEGTMYVEGGGVNSITIEDSTISKMVVQRSDDRVRVRITDAAQLSGIMIQSGAIIEIGAGVQVDTLIIHQPIELILEDGAAIEHLVLNEGAGGTEITGQGIVKQADILSAGVTVNGEEVDIGQIALPVGSKDQPSPPVVWNPGPVTPPSNGDQELVIDLVDPDATPYTRSLFVYLNNLRGERILFGQQHVTDEGFSITDPMGTDSDVNTAVGDYPAIFGWDTLSLDGYEKPGVNGDEQLSLANTIMKMKQAHDLGGILTLSTHPYNPVTGEDFYDTSIRTVEQILPGQPYHDQLNAYLDRIAELALNLVDDEGQHIPIIFRPWHEQTGSWFWWGAATTSTDEYISLYRYTVEYLRDQRGVHNLLYAWSPNGPYGGDAAKYLETYPGDDYVDILGMDQYDNQDDPGSEGFLASFVEDYAMISRLADDKGKISAITEFGYSPMGMKESGNGDLEWFTRLLNALKADPDAKRVAYMQTWANFGYPTNVFVPYKDAVGYGDHELLEDFIAFYQDPYTGFAAENVGVYDYVAETKPKQSFMYIAAPLAHSTVTQSTIQVLAKVLHESPDMVTYSVNGSATEVEMQLNERGYYAAAWAPAAEMNGQSATITVRTYDAEGQVTHEQSNIVFLQVDEIVVRAYGFDDGIEGIQNNGTYPDSMQLDLAHAIRNGNGMLQLSVTDMVYTDTWQELKLELPDIGQEVPLTTVNRVKLDVYIPVAAGSRDEHATVRGVVMIPPDWSAKYGMTTTEKLLSDLENVDGEWLRYPITIDIDQQEAMASGTSIAISIVGSGLDYTGPIYVDDIRLINHFFKEPGDPNLVDDFEQYMGSSELLNSAYVPAGDGSALSLVPAAADNGQHMMKFEYTLGNQGYTGRIKVLGGVDWSANNQLRFWLEPDGLDQKMVVQLKVASGHYEAYPSLAGSDAGWVTLHFHDFVPAPWDTAAAGTSLTQNSLKQVQHLAIYINAVEGAELSSVLYIDEIRAIYDPAAPDVPGGGTDPGEPSITPGILYGFEDGAEGWVVEQNRASATAPVVSQDLASEGTQSLMSTFDLEGDDFELAKIGKLDLSNMNQLSAKLTLSQGTAKARLYVKTGSSWQWFDSGMVQIDANDWTIVTIDLTEVTNRDEIQSIGIKLEEFTGAGNATLYLDEVRISE